MQKKPKGLASPPMSPPHPVEPADDHFRDISAFLTDIQAHTTTPEESPNDPNMPDMNKEIPKSEHGESVSEHGAEARAQRMDGSVFSEDELSDPVDATLAELLDHDADAQGRVDDLDVLMDDPHTSEHNTHTATLSVDTMVMHQLATS